MVKYLYLHGFASSPNSEKAQFFVNKLSENSCECFAPDLNSEEFTHLLITEQVIKLSKLFENTSDEYMVIGSSLGGIIALNLAEKFICIKKCLLLAPAFNISKLWDKNVGKEYMQYWSQNGYLEIPHHAYGKNLALHYNFVEDVNENLIDMKFTRELPVSIFHGLNDETIPYSGSEEYLAENKRATLKLLNSDHSLQNSLDMIWQESIEFLEVK